MSDDNGPAGLTGSDGGPAGGGGRFKARAGESRNVVDMVPSLFRGSAHGLFASGPAIYLNRLSQFDPRAGALEVPW